MRIYHDERPLLCTARCSGAARRAGPSATADTSSENEINADY